MKIGLLPLLSFCVAISSSQSLAETAVFTTSTAPMHHVVNFTPDNGAANRIGAADRLRTLSQEISAEVCFLHNGVLVDQNHSALTHSISEFDEILNALLNGDVERHIIGAEERLKTIREIEAIMAEWAPLHQAAQDVLTDPGNIDAVHLIYEQSEHLLDTTSHLLSELEGEYSHPTEVFMSDVLLIEFAGRQAMLTQKIAFEACLVWSGYGGTEQIDDLQKICDHFDLIARALQNGMDGTGITPAPTTEISEALEHVVADWDEVMVHLEHIVEGEETDQENMGWIDQVLTNKMHRMEAVVEMYVAYSRRAII